MEKSVKNKLTKYDYLFIITGLLVAAFMCLPFFINGKGSIITYHDQLDGELLTYIINARHLFDNLKAFPELMNGIPRQGLCPPAPGLVLLFWAFDSFTAFMIIELLIKLVSFSSMYLLLRKLFVRNYIAFIVSLAFMAMPFYVVYGLCIPGMPALIYAYALISDTDRSTKKLILAGVIAALYAFNSSLALCGFGIIIGALVYTALLVFTDKKKLSYVCILDGIVIISYALVNISLIKQILGISTDFVSHKTEIVAYSSKILSSLFSILLNGMDYADGGHRFFIIIILGLIIVGFVIAIKKKTKIAKNKHLYMSAILLGINILIALLIALYSSEFFVNIRNSSTGVIHTFNFSRIGWLSPCLWYISLALASEAVIRMANKKVLVIVISVVVYISLLGSFAFNLYKSDVKSNVMKILKHGDYYMMTWEQFYAEDLFEQVDELIGLPKEDYRIVSYGIYPAAASYNGFYCLDAYSNNYDLEYKHEFRKVIAPELSKSDYLRDWYDNWGNRCYILCAETNNYFTFEKRWSPCTESISIDTSVLKEMGCDYIVSASYLFDPDSIGVELLSENPIMTDDSWYRLWVYKIK